ncbi:MAG: hypothetical protein R3C32_12500 [Chloroflexota bacterium]
MTSWLVESYAPGSTDLAEVDQRAREAAATLTLAGTPVRYVRTIFVRGDETCFHVFEGPIGQALREGGATRLARGGGSWRQSHEASRRAGDRRRRHPCDAGRAGPAPVWRSRPRACVVS